MKKIPEMSHETGYLDTPGARIHYQSWVPGVMRDVMVVAHGLGEHSGRYKNLVNHFVPKGVGIYALDHRGHGLSSGIRGHVQSFLNYRDDLAAFVNKVLEETGKKKIILVGHSMGGVVATSYSLRHPDKISRLILSSPGLQPHKLPSKLKETAAKVLARLMPTLLMANELDATQVSRDAEVVKAYVNDPLVHDRVSPKFYVEFLNETARLIREASRLSVPLLLLQAGQDRLVDPGTNKNFFSRVGSDRKQMKVYEDLYHELFNEPEKDQVFSDMEAWLGMERPDEEPSPAAKKPARSASQSKKAAGTAASSKKKKASGGGAAKAGPASAKKKKKAVKKKAKT